VQVLISRLGSDDAAARAREDRLVALSAGAARVLVVPHLYHLPETSSIWARLAALDGPVLAATWLHPRPAEWLLRRHGVGASGLTVLSLLADDCFAALRALLGEAGGAGTVEELSEAATPRWYPVVDRDRCRECGHCRQFCLFGVYAAGPDGQLVVANPDRCKPGCPACSRVCPEGAILFPLYTQDDAIAGAPGRLMTPDPAARRMLARHCGIPCPACRQAGPAATPAPGSDAPICPECGRALASAPEPEPAAGEVFDEIDALIDDLDALTERRS
jgi:NAD-dependent dihydropyrimidine dehydrogenase PreA subunit